MYMQLGCDELCCRKMLLASARVNCNTGNHMTACNCAHQTHKSIQLLYITCCNTTSQRNRITQACRRMYLYSCETDATRHAAGPLHEGMIAVTLPCALPCNTGDIIIHARWIRNHAIEIGSVHMHTHTLSDVCTYKSNIEFILLASTPW
jgi:hypothetical protein